MKVLAPTTAFPRFQGDVNGHFILEMFNGISNFNFTVIAPSDSTAKPFEKIDNVKVNRINYMWNPKYQKLTYGEGIHANLKKSLLAKIQVPILGISLVYNINKHLRSHNLIHAQMVFAGYASYLAKSLRNSRIPLVISFYGKDILNCMQNKMIYRPMLKNSNLILALSKDMEKMLIKIGVKKYQIKIHHLGIDCRKFSYKKPSKSHDKVRFLTVARFVEKKGISFGIKAFSKVVKKFPKCKLVLVGDGPELKNLVRLTKQLNLERSVEFINNLKSPNPRKVTMEEFKKADIFLLPSITTRDDYGGTPIALMESQARGVPCIVFNDAGNSEIVVNGKTGFVVEQKNIENLSEKMIELTQNYSLRKRFSIAARKYILEEFNNDIQIKRLQNIYYSLYENLENENFKNS